MGKARSNVFSPFRIIEIFMLERQGGSAATDDAARSRIAHCAAARGPVDLDVGVSTPCFPGMDSSLVQIVADEFEVVISGWIARNTPLRTLFGQMAIAEQNSIQPRIVFLEARDSDSFFWNDLRDKIASLQLSG